MLSLLLNVSILLHVLPNPNQRHPTKVKNIFASRLGNIKYQPLLIKVVFDVFAV